MINYHYNPANLQITNNDLFATFCIVFLFTFLRRLSIQYFLTTMTVFEFGFDDLL